MDRLFQEKQRFQGIGALRHSFRAVSVQRDNEQVCSVDNLIRNIRSEPYHYLIQKREMRSEKPDLSEKYIKDPPYDVNIRRIPVLLIQFSKNICVSFFIGNETISFPSRSSLLMSTAVILPFS